MYQGNNMNDIRDLTPVKVICVWIYNKSHVRSGTRDNILIRFKNCIHDNYTSNHAHLFRYLPEPHTLTITEMRIQQQSVSFLTCW